MKRVGLVFREGSFVCGMVVVGFFVRCVGDTSFGGVVNVSEDSIRI